jgi:hypothetical protein
LASPFLPPPQLPGLLSRVAALSRRSSKSAATANLSSGAAAAAADGGDVTVAEILAVAQSCAHEVADMARVGAATAAVLPLLQCAGSFSCMRPHARAAAAALVLTLDELLIEELCRCVRKQYLEHACPLLPSFRIIKPYHNALSQPCVPIRRAFVL